MGTRKRAGDAYVPISLGTFEGLRAQPKRLMRRELILRGDMPRSDPRMQDHIPQRIAKRNGTSMYIPDDPAENATETFDMCLRDAARAPIGTLLGLYASALTIIAPSLKDALISVLAEQGLEPVNIRVPSECAARMVDTALDRELNPAQVTVLWGASLLLIFKNVGPESYGVFMASRINALKARVGVDPDFALGLPFDLGPAQKIRSIFGASNLLRRRAVEFIIKNGDGDGMLSQCCHYLKSLLAWSGMHPLRFVYDALCVTGSPVLLEPSVQGEVESVAEAYQAIMRQNYPAFFRFFAPPEDQYLLERSRFPVLITVAVVIRSKDYPTLRNFVTPVRVNDENIQYLVNLHTADMRAPRHRLISEPQRFLMKNCDFSALTNPDINIATLEEAEHASENEENTGR